MTSDQSTGVAASTGPFIERADRDAAMLRAFLAARDVACPRCGYNLRLLTGDRCSECGTELTLTVNAVEPVQRLWVAATVIVTLGAGVGLMFVAIILGQAGPPPREWHWIIGLSWAFMPLVPALVYARRRFLRAARALQIGIVAAMGTALAVLVAGVMSTVR